MSHFLMHPATGKCFSTGWVPDRLDHRDVKYTAPSGAAVDPSIPIDYRAGLPPVYDQGPLGSCVGNGTAAAFQYALMRESAKHVFQPSRLFIYYNARNREGNASQDAGCEIRDAIKSLNEDGVVPEASWPYNVRKFATHPPAPLYQQALQNQLIVYARVDQTQDHMLACLSHHGLIVFGASVFQEIMDAPGGHIPMPDPNAEPVGGHCMVVVGWRPDSKEYIIRNSWGTNWGDHGYGYMPADYLHNTDLASDFWVLWLTEKP